MSSVPRVITGISKADSTLSKSSQPPPVLTIPDDKPVASSNAINYLQKITETDLKYSVFTDELVTYSEMQSEMGVYKVKTKKTCYKGVVAVEVCANSDGKIDGILCWTKVHAYIGKNLETLYQELDEAVKIEQGPLERKTISELTNDGLKVTKTVKQGDKKETFEKLFDQNIIEGYISEGANILLQRIMIIKGFPDYFDVISFDSDTNLCLSDYRDLPTVELKIGDAIIKCFGIERKIHSLTGTPVMWHTFYMCDGHLINRTQVGSPIMMKVVTVPELMEHDEYLETPLIKPKELDWKEDLQMISLFKDRKNELVSNYKNYCRNHPELQDLVSDFMQAILVHKPDDTVKFAGNFFATFSNRFYTGYTTPHATNMVSDPAVVSSKP